MGAQATEQKLPEGFEHLSDHLEWARWDERERMQLQIDSTVEELAVFYDAVLPHVAEIYAHLANVPADDSMSDEDRTLFSLAVAFAETADGVEYYSPESTSAAAMPRFKISHDILGWRWTPVERLP